ncbi:MAG: mercury(II) reductase [Anaerolineae bacterium]
MEVTGFVEDEQKVALRIIGMTCDSCAAHVEKALAGVPGVIQTHVPGWDSGRAELVAGADVPSKALVGAVQQAGYNAAVEARRALQPFDRAHAPSRARRGDRPDGNVQRSSGDGQYDLMIIGAGSAGFGAAIKAAELGHQVALVEASTIGGTCVNVGCVPSKTLIRATEKYFEASGSRFRGVNTTPGQLYWSQVIGHKDELVAELRQAKYWDVLDAYPSVSYIQGRARLAGGNTVEINGEVYRPGKIVITTGASPWAPPIPGLKEAGYLTSTTAMDLRHVPRSMIVLGANAVGLEQAQVYARAGSHVTVIELLERIVPFEDEAISQALAGYLQDEGMTIVTGASTQRVDRRGGQYRLQVKLSDGTEATFAAEELLVATGRRPNTAGLGLEEAGVEVDRRGAIVVNEFLQTTNPDVYAAGDVVGRDMFVYVAAYGGGLAAENALTGAGRVYDTTALPKVTFTDPQVASVGLTEAQAVEAGYNVRTSVLPLEYVPRALAARDTRGLIKLVADGDTDRLLGAHVLAHEGSEIIQIAVLAIRFGITVHDLTDTLFPYLTLAEGLKLAAQTFEKDVAMLSCCAG